MGEEELSLSGQRRADVFTALYVFLTAIHHTDVSCKYRAGIQLIHRWYKTGTKTVQKNRTFKDTTGIQQVYSWYKTGTETLQRYRNCKYRASKQQVHNWYKTGTETVPK